MQHSVTVLAGGSSKEREVSLRSGAAVADALRKKGYKVTLADPRDGLDGIGKPDVVFPALHGAGGEDGTIQAALENIGVPYVGSGVAASALCFDKWLYRSVAAAGGLPLANGELVTLDTIWQSPLARQPFVLKPVQGGSTIDTYIIRNTRQLDKKPLKRSLQQYGIMLLETLIPGIEITVGILGEQALPPVEIVPPKDSEFDYDNKYNGKTKELCPPVHVSTGVQKQAQELALRVHRLTGCRDISRTDMIIAPDNTIIILETNTLPGMTDQSLFPKAAAVADIAFLDLCDQLVRMALQRQTTA